MEEKYPIGRLSRWTGYFFLSIYMRLFKPGKWDIFVLRLNCGKNHIGFWLSTKMVAVNQKFIAQATLMMSSMFLSVGHMYGLLLFWKMKMKQTANNIMLYFLQKRNYRRSEEKLGKIRNLYPKKRSCWHKIFKVGMMFSGEIYDKNFYQTILSDAKNFRIPKADFEALVAELRPYISPNPLSPYYL